MTPAIATAYATADHAECQTRRDETRRDETRQDNYLSWLRRPSIGTFRTAHADPRRTDQPHEQPPPRSHPMTTEPRFTPTDEDLDLTPRCPQCGHQPHGDWCPNMASDNDCNCTGAPRPVGSVAAREVRLPADDALAAAVSVIRLGVPDGSAAWFAIDDVLGWLRETREQLVVVERCRDSFGDTLANIRDMTEHVDAAPLAAAAVLDSQDFVPWGRVARLEAEVERLGTLLALTSRELREAKASRLRTPSS